MKKLILSLLIFCSAFVSAQISIPQVTGLPAALNSKVDKVTGKSLVADTLSAKIQPTATAVATKEPLLPSTPSNPESRFLNGNKQWAEIVLGSGGYASNVYFTNLTSAIVGTYKQTSGTHELTETIASGTCNNNEVLIHTYLFEQPVGITTVDAGVWRFTMNCKINSNVGDSKFKIVQFKRSSTGVETDMFTIYSNTIENTDYQNFIIETVQPSFLVDSLDRFGCRIYATTTTTVNKTISYKVGDGNASYLNTPLALRHQQLRDPNGDSNAQHLTAVQVAKVNATSGTNTGDETLTSIKTKLGAATAVSDGYLKYQDWNAFNNKQPAGAYLTGITSGQVTTALGYTPKPTFTENTAFNKNFGNTSGTVLEGRTFGTAANNSTGDFIQNQNSSAQSANMWISGSINADKSGETFRSVGTNDVPKSLRLSNGVGNAYFGIDDSAGNFFGKGGYSTNIYSPTRNLAITSLNFNLTQSGAATFASTVNATQFQSTVATGTAPLTVNSTTMANNLNAQYLNGFTHNGGLSSSRFNGDLNTLGLANSSGLYSIGGVLTNNPSIYGALLATWNGDVSTQLYLSYDGDMYWRKSIGTTYTGSVWRTIYDSGNLTNNLSTNCLPKWNGSRFVNSLISDNASTVTINSTTQSTSPTTGALVVGGGIGADHVRANNFYGSGSNLTGVQLPITLTTNGTSGAATFSGNVLNVPNYSSTGTGGTYACPPTNVTNLTSSSIGMSLYTKTGSVYRVSISGLINPAAPGTCVIRLPMPTNISGGVVPMCYSSSSFTTPQGWSVSAGSNYIDLSINTNGSACQFYANIAYVY